MQKLLFTLCLLFSSPVFGQVNVALLHQLVEDSKKEHERQSKAKTNQAKNAINEEVNRNLMGQVKVKYRTLQERYAKLNLLIEAVGLSSSANPLLRSIIGHQEQITFHCQKDPLLIPLALETEKLFVKQSYSLMNYLIGLAASIGDLNQMKVSERRLLLQHVIQELRSINRLASATSQTLASEIRRRSAGNNIPQYPNEATEMVDEILANIQLIKD
ncbi:hypothetical protein SAMN04488057_11268 [Cyclobacterium lianum]|uniref:Uncharacterized protein n=1 Tax=Cyclobacterium lianum TaxID=388280 RepID=A0A1M7PZA1_9BACT|nr:hypothetical protein [Cyclobacterium lianum]SHN23163.1 hypothetical protein SAMN04488057_11268 [Cyclobacterium lianum]